MKLQQMIKEEVRRALLRESLGTWKAAGIPDELSKYILRNYKFNQNDPFETVTDMPKSSEFFAGHIIINILGPDRAIAVANIKDGGFVRFELSGGTVDVQYETSLKNAARGMSRKGQFVKSRSINILYGNRASRGNKPSPQDIAMKSTSDPLAGSIDMIYAYMNKTFMPGIKPKLEAVVDNIYTNLRKLSNTRQFVWDTTDQETALYYVKSIESIAKNGFNRENMKKFLDSLNEPELKSVRGFGEIPLNDKILAKALQTPNARAKWAKTVLDSAMRYDKYIKDMLLNKSNPTN